MAKPKSMSEIKTTWGIFPQNEGQDMNFMYNFHGSQEEVMEEMRRVAQGLRNLFRFPSGPGNSRNRGQQGTFSCRAEGEVGGGTVSLKL